MSDDDVVGHHRRGASARVGFAYLAASIVVAGDPIQMVRIGARLDGERKEDSTDRYMCEKTPRHT